MRGGEVSPLAPTSSRPVVYSAENPAPQHPGQPAATSRAAFSIDARANRNAMIGFVAGIIAIFFNFLFIVAPFAIVFSIMGIVRARQLKAAGVTNNLMAFALIGLALGILSGAIGLATIIGFIVSAISVTIS